MKEKDKKFTKLNKQIERISTSYKPAKTNSQRQIKTERDPVKLKTPL